MREVNYNILIMFGLGESLEADVNDTIVCNYDEITEMCLIHKRFGNLEHITTLVQEDKYVWAVLQDGTPAIEGHSRIVVPFILRYLQDLAQI